MTVKTYSTYLKVEELLSLQQPVSERPEHDEMLFIVIHQVYELWFKQVLHELDHLQASLIEGELSTAMATFKRVLKILKTLVAQVDVLETMTPVQFSSFRDRLDQASGFQSAQFREVEFVLGHRRRAMLDHMPEGSAERARLERRSAEPSLWVTFLSHLASRGYDVPPEALEAASATSVGENEGVQSILIDIYRNDPVSRELCELMVDFDEGLQEWRYRHVKMVERTIGTKQGTGGSPGAEYLRTTLFRPLFPDLWAIRASL